MINSDFEMLYHVEAVQLRFGIGRIEDAGIRKEILYRLVLETEEKKGDGIVVPE